MSYSAESLACAMAVLLPGVLFVASLWLMLQLVRRHRNGALSWRVYTWLAVYSLVMALAAMWLAKSLLSLTTQGLPEDLAHATMRSGPAFFVALALPLVLRPVLEGVHGMLGALTRWRKKP